MLILKRRIGEAIHIGDEIVIYVNRCGGNRVVLGIEAPQSIGIRRGELTAKPSGETAASACHASLTQGNSPEPPPIPR